jgi:PPP family 3-phenylpropionic acid transporter
MTSASGPVARGTKPIEPERAVIGMFLLFGIAIAAFFPFFALFLADKGFSADGIGLVLALMAGARLIANPLWGQVADAKLGRLRTLRLGLAGLSVMAVVIFAVQGAWAVAAVAAVFAAVASAVGPNTDAIALIQLGESRMADYPKIRALESLSYAVTCLVLGAVLQAAGVRWSMIAYAGASLLLFAWSFTLAVDTPTPRDRARDGRLGTVGAVFREAPGFWLYMVALLLVWTGFNAAWNFFALRIEAAGGGPMLVGLGTALGGAIEVPFMLSASRLHRRYGLRRTWIAGALVYAVAFVLWGAVNDPRIVSFLTVFEGIGFSLLFTTGVVIVGTMVPRSLYSTGQSLSVMVGFGLGPIIGAGLGGLVFERLGPLWLYCLASGIVLIGAGVGWFALRGPGLTGGLATTPVEPVEPVDLP